MRKFVLTREKQGSLLFLTSVPFSRFFLGKQGCSVLRTKAPHFLSFFFSFSWVASLLCMEPIYVLSKRFRVLLPPTRGSSVISCFVGNGTVSQRDVNSISYYLIMIYRSSRSMIAQFSSCCSAPYVSSKEMCGLCTCAYRH